MNFLEAYKKVLTKIFGLLEKVTIPTEDEPVWQQVEREEFERKHVDPFV